MTNGCLLGPPFQDAFLSAKGNKECTLETLAGSLGVASHAGSPSTCLILEGVEERPRGGGGEGLSKEDRTESIAIIKGRGERRKGEKVA
jgi:hypothetical protein